MDFWGRQQDYLVVLTCWFFRLVWHLPWLHHLIPFQTKGLIQLLPLLQIFATNFMRMEKETFAFTLFEMIGCTFGAFPWYFVYIAIDMAIFSVLSCLSASYTLILVPMLSRDS